MKLLILLDRFSRQEASTYSHFVDLCEFLVKEGIEIHIVTSDTSAEVSKQNITVHKISYSEYFFYLPFLILKVIRIIRDYKIELVYAHIHSKLLFAGTISARITNRPAVIWHCGLSNYDISLIRTKLAQFSLNKKLIIDYVSSRLFLTSLYFSKKLITGTYIMRHLYNQILGMPTEKIIVLPNFVDTKRFNSDNQDRNLKTKLGLSQEDFVLGFVGSLSPRKGVKNLLKAMSILINDNGYRNVKCLIIGGHFFDKRKEELRIIEYQSFSEELDIERNVKFIGSISNLLLPNYLNLINVLILPSKPTGEGFPRVLIEAMACGKAVIVSKFPGVSEIVTHGKTGILVKPENIDELSKAIEKLYIYRDLVASMGANGRTIAEKKYDVNVIANKWIKIFKETIEESVKEIK